MVTPCGVPVGVPPVEHAVYNWVPADDAFQNVSFTFLVPFGTGMPLLSERRSW